jgi:excinuclease ABC subunit C
MLSLVNQTQDDGAEYYGPFGSRGVTNSMLKAVRSALGLPDCTKHFPRDIGKDRPCLNYHMKLCAGWCQQEKTQEEYISQIQLARKLLNGDFKSVTDELKTQMLLASDALNFELAASIRDRINAIEALNKDQKVIASVGVDTDVIGYAQMEAKACVVILHYSNGDLLDKDYQVISTPEDSSVALSALIKQYYYNRRTAPKYIFLPFELEDIDLFAQLLEQQFQKKATFKVPKRGDKLRLIELANQNAKEEALRVTKLDESHNATLLTLRKMLGIAS